MVETNFVNTLNKNTVVNALGYTPAGGENLVLDSGTEVNVPNGVTPPFTLSEELIKGEIYTLTVWCEIDDTKTGLAVTLGSSISSGSPMFNKDLQKKANGVFSYSGPIVANKESAYKEKQFIFNPHPWTDKNGFKVLKVKLEPGTVTDPVWTPAPEDVVTKGDISIKTSSDLLSDVDSLPFGFNVLYTNSTTKNTPYTDKLTSVNSSGFTLVFKESNRFITIVYIPVSLPKMYIRVKDVGAWKAEWVEYLGTAKTITASDEPTDDMEIN